MFENFRNPSHAAEVRSFRAQRSAFFADAAQVVGKVQLKSILALQVKANEDTALGRAFETIEERYKSGRPLSEAFGDYLPDGERQAMRGWDEARSDAELAEGFSVIGQLSAAFGAIRKAAIGSAVQAISSFGLAMSLMFMMKKNVYPNFSQQFPVEKWMLPARMVYFAINGMFSNLPIFLLVFGVIVGGYIYSLGNWTSPVRRRLDSTLFYSWYRSIRSLQVLLAMALHLKAKRGVGTSTRLIMEQSNRWETWYLEEMRVRNQEGVTGGGVFDVGFFDRPIVNRLVLLSAAGSVENAMEQIALLSQKELLEEFRARLTLVGVTAKNIALLIGVVPIALFFLTIGDYITASAMSGFKAK
ncbi:MAG: hypothetical protein ACREIG_08605 [Nitrospiraceae bacterium]